MIFKNVENAYFILHLQVTRLPRIKKSVCMYQKQWTLFRPGLLYTNSYQWTNPNTKPTPKRKLNLKF